MENNYTSNLNISNNKSGSGNKFNNYLTSNEVNWKNR